MPKRLYSLEELELTPREKEAIKFIAQWPKTHRYPKAPNHRELLAYLNKVLPKSVSGGPALVSLEQTRRLANQLRAKGILVSGVEVYKMPRNLVLTQFGEQVTAKLMQ